MLRWTGAACLLGGGLYLAASRGGVTYAAGREQAGTEQVATQAGGSQQVGTDVYETAVKPMIRANCVGCHNAVKMKGDLDLDAYLAKSGADALKSREVLELVMEKLRAGEMPPAGKPRPPAEQVAAATGWIEQEYAALDAKAAPNPGRVTAHRLNRYEYNNTVRDLLGVNLRFADDFPPDPYGYGFDNIGDVLSLSPMLTEKYMKAAERVANAAIPVGPPMKPVVERYQPEVMGLRNHMRVQVTHDFPVEGQYLLRFGWEQTLTMGAVIRGHIFLDGEEVMNKTQTIDRRKENGFESDEVRVTQGPHVLEAWIETPAGYKGGNPYLTLIAVNGPFHPASYRETAGYRQIFFRGPPGAGEQPVYAREILARLARRAYRRPVTSAEVTRLVGLTRLVRSHGGSFEEGIQVALEAVLMSPDFLFRIEQDPVGETRATHRVSDVELASRLSYFLWSSMPDDELLGVAVKGRLHDPEVLHAQVRRMLANAKARSLANNFGGEWLQTRNLQFQKPDHKTFPEYDLELQDAMRTETEMFFQSIVTEDRSILDFVDGKFTFLNERLARLYGIPGVEGREFRRVSLDGTQRSGVVTQASVLTASSYPTRTSPVIRGKWLLENILNTPPPPPPPNVPPLDVHDVGSVASVRQRLEEHRANPVCAGCHARMDPLGFGLENYDAIGRWRTTEGSLPIDTSGLLPDGRTFDGAAALKAILQADAPKFVRGFTEKMLIYALGRGIESYDKPAVAKIATRVQQNGDRFSEVVLGIVDSMPFQMREREAPVVPVPGSQTAMVHGVGNQSKHTE